MGLRSAVAINVATMVGAGPFITLPLVVTALNGSVSAVAWVLGAVIALCDGLVWAELASRYPRSGGSYVYLREAFGPRGPGRLIAFLFVWQFMFWAPLILASGYIGFAQYSAYLFPALANPIATHAVAVAVGLITLVALYRAIPQIARTALILGAVALLTLAVVAFAGITHPYAPLGGTVARTVTFGFGIFALGGALVNTLYDYGGYGDVCSLGDEVLAATRTIPRAVVLSVLFVGAAYVLLNLGVAAAVAPKEIAASNAIASLVAHRAFGAPFAVAVTVAVMITAFGSTYGLLLAAARVPYAAALDGDFLRPFARLHPRGRFPDVALVTIGVLALPASLLSLDAVINALTAGIVLVQGAGQIVALFRVRAAQPDAPFRVPLFPIPPLIALAGWIVLFFSTGRVAILFGLATLAIGALVFLIHARVVRSWPFAPATLAALLALIAFAHPFPAAASDAPAFGHAMLTQARDGDAMLTLDGKPFFVLGGAFFYERIPRSRWRDAMQRMRELGANTLDLYVPWNWHELADGDFDFDGRTSPRRDLREVLRLGKEMGFYFIVRPGPVIRNEWRNGGYPAWLLQRPEYGMPLHDVLEGRYPATATLQNAHSDDAAAEWMRNDTHMRYAARWLHLALDEFRPVADRVIAVQLDDDQGAYLDNDTYPAPHLHAYLGWLERQAREVVGPLTPTFINTFEMKVPSSSPVWTMGNWYQSDAYAIGEHDRAELAFATASLRTREGAPLAYSEFQAGWLAGPEDPQPRPADPSNTTLALGELAGWGVKGLIDFPLFDTLGPFGWEAPFSNALYAWDAAYDLDLRPYSESPDVHSSRWSATRKSFASLAFFGRALTESHRVADVAVLYDGRSDAFRASAALKADLAACRARDVTCDAIDPGAVSDHRLRGFRYAVVHGPGDAGMAGRARALGVRIVASVDEALDARRMPHATLLRGPHATFAVIENWSDAPLRVDPRAFGTPAASLAPFIVQPRDARIAVLDADLAFLSPRFRPGDRLSTTCPLWRVAAGDASFGGVSLDGPPPRSPLCSIVARFGGVRVRRDLAPYESYDVASNTTTTKQQGAAVRRDVRHDIDLSPHASFVPAAPRTPPAASAKAYRADVFEDGGSDIVLENASVRAIIVPDGGGRIVAFDLQPPAADIAPFNAFDATGALRDDTAIQPPPSTTDRIAKYTHTYPAGMFNRTYEACTFGDARAVGSYLAYDAPDVVPAGARFERTIALAANAARLVVDERFAPAKPDATQRLVSLSGLAVRNGAMLYDGPASVPAGRPVTLEAQHAGVSLETPSDNRVVSVAWRPGDVEAASWVPARSNGTLRLVFAPGGWRRITIARYDGKAGGPIRAFVEAERAWVAANRPPSGEVGEVAKRYTQSPQKRPSESSCGFESHLPQ